MRVFILSSSYSYRRTSCRRTSGGFGAAQLLDKVSLKRSPHRRDRDQAEALAAQGIDHGILLVLIHDGADAVSGNVALRAQSLDRGWDLRAMPDHFHFPLNARGQILDRAHAAKFSLVNDGH